MGGFAFCLGSASGASVVALDNKIEQAMVSGITASLPSPDLAAAYVTLGRSEGVEGKAFSRYPMGNNCQLPIFLWRLQSTTSELGCLLGHSQLALATLPPFELLHPRALQQPLAPP